jgi:hypothetical protein
MEHEYILKQMKSSVLGLMGHLELDMAFKMISVPKTVEQRHRTAISMREDTANTGETQLTD